MIIDYEGQINFLEISINKGKKLVIWNTIFDFPLNAIFIINK